MSEQTIISTEGLSRTYGTIKAVENLDLDVPRGIVYGFLGQNGAGKTTTIRLLLGLAGPTSGTARIFGLDVGRNAQKIRERSSTLLEHTGLYERLTVQDNLEFEARSRGLSSRDRKERIRDLLDRFELSDRKTEQAGKLSRGMKQKLAVARTMLAHPDLIFLDEPTTGLDVLTANRIREEIARLCSEEGATVFLTTHNLVEAESLCSRIGIIRSGSLVFSGSPSELRSKSGNYEVSIEIGTESYPEHSLEADLERTFPRIRNLRVERTRIQFNLEPELRTAPVVEYLVKKGIPVEEVKKGAASLEKAFLNLLTEESGEDA